MVGQTLSIAQTSGANEVSEEFDYYFHLCIINVRMDLIVFTVCNRVN